MIFKIDNFPPVINLRTRQMNFHQSSHIMNKATAAGDGLHGIVWISSVYRRPMLANLRKESVARPDEIVIG